MLSYAQSANERSIRKEKDALAAGAERARVAREPRNDAPQLVWPPDAPQRVQARPLRKQVRVRVEVRCGHATARRVRIWGAQSGGFRPSPRYSMTRNDPDCSRVQVVDVFRIRVARCD